MTSTFQVFVDQQLLEPKTSSQHDQFNPGAVSRQTEFGLRRSVKEQLFVSQLRVA